MAATMTNWSAVPSPNMTRRNVIPKRMTAAHMMRPVTADVGDRRTCGLHQAIAIAITNGLTVER